MRLLATAALTLATTGALAQMSGTANRARVTAGTYRVDPNHTQVTWQVNHLGISLLQGQFGAASGTLVLDPARPAATTLDVTFNTTELSATGARFAAHLKSKDFFDVERFPTARFVSTRIATHGTAATIVGDLTIKDVTRPVSLSATLVGAGDSPSSRKRNIGFRATGTISRGAFGLGFAPPAASDKVDLTINAAFEAS